MLLKSLKNIKNELSNISLNNPKFNNVDKELINTKKICEEYENIKRMLIEKFEFILSVFDNFNDKIKNLKLDEKIVSDSFILNNEIKLVSYNKEIDFSLFKEKFKFTLYYFIFR